MAGNRDPTKCDHADLDWDDDGPIQVGWVRSYDVVCSDCGTKMTVAFDPGDPKPRAD
jgi:hypothetical protein